MMYSYLIDHAAKNVWCNNDQDNQLVIAAQRITKLSGALNRLKLMHRNITLPSSGKFYHVYQVGHVHPNILGLIPFNPSWILEKWIKFSDAINDLKLVVNIYDTTGIELPRFKSYYMFTNDRSLIFAIEEDTNFPINYSSDRLYVRLYTNAYFQSYRSDLLNDYTYCRGKDILNINDVLALQAEYNTYADKEGHVFAYKNGFLIDKIDAVNVTVGDTVEFIYDSSIKKIVTFTIGDLHTFNSTLDNKRKYLLHYEDGDNDTIDYLDDNDIHILYQSTPDRFLGVYYHRNVIDSVRMVTHRDYSLAVDYVNYLGTELNATITSEQLDINQLKIQLKIRKSGYHRPLIHDNNRIFELYKLDDDLIIQSMVGVNSTALEWRAESLENSAYCRLMRGSYGSIDLALIQEAYGYNSLSRIVGDTPTKTTLKSFRQSADLPYGLYENCTVYEYDENGKMVDWRYHPVGSDYETMNLDVRMIEAISGKGSYAPDVRFGVNNIALPVYDNYRVYICQLLDNIPDNKWMDITGTELYRVEHHELIWNNDVNGHYLMVRSDKTFLAYDIDILPIAGTLYFTLSELETREGVEENHTLSVPLGELDIFLNGMSLIRGVDYILNFPMIYIVNKTHLVQPANSTVQKLHVRFTGFCKADLSLDDIEDYGFIEHGFLSNNSRHDIRDDKVLRITVAGGLVHRDDVLFSETNDGISVVNADNGKPYQIKDIVVPLKQLVDENTYTMRVKSQLIDYHISNYLTVKLPQPERNAVSSIYNRYPLISPFICHIVNDLANNQFDNSQFITALSDNDIMNICKPYEHILAFDPISEANRIDARYVIIYPHNLDNTIDLDIYQFRFLTRVVKLYGNNLIELSPFITFST